MRTDGATDGATSRLSTTAATGPSAAPARTGPGYIYNTISTLSCSGHVSGRGIFSLNWFRTYWGHFARVYTTLREKGRSQSGGSNCPVSEAAAPPMNVAFQQQWTGRQRPMLTPYLGIGWWDFKKGYNDVIMEPSLSLYLSPSVRFWEVTCRWWLTERSLQLLAAVYANLFIYCRVLERSELARPVLTKKFTSGDFSRDEPQGEDIKIY